MSIFQRLDHVSIGVHDLETARRLFVDVFGGDRWRTWVRTRRGLSLVDFQPRRQESRAGLADAPARGASAGIWPSRATASIISRSAWPTSTRPFATSRRTASGCLAPNTTNADWKHCDLHPQDTHGALIQVFEETCDAGRRHAALLRDDPWLDVGLRVCDWRYGVDTNNAIAASQKCALIGSSCFFPVLLKRCIPPHTHFKLGNFFRTGIAESSISQPRSERISRWCIPASFSNPEMSMSVPFRLRCVKSSGTNPAKTESVILTLFNSKVFSCVSVFNPAPVIWQRERSKDSSLGCVSALIRYLRLCSPRDSSVRA